MHIRRYTNRDRDAVIHLSLRAWAPVFDALQCMMDPEIYRTFYPEQWQVSQQQSVEEVCGNDSWNVWVAVDAEVVVGFIAVKLHPADQMGEVHMIAVDPDHQQCGIGTALISDALAWMKDQGMAIAMVETGGDPGHAPARHTYEKAGFSLLPIARYFKKL